MLFSPAKGETERLLDYGTTRAGENKPWHPAARFATGALVTVFAVRVPASSDETDAAPRACMCPTLTVLSRPPYSQTLFIFAIVEAPYEGIGEQGTFATSTKPSAASLSGHDDAPKSQPVAVTPAAAVARVGIQTRENAVARRDRCAGMGSNATVCVGTNGCETWRGECQVQCNTLATEDACGVSAKCEWDATYHSCNSRKLPTCTSSNTRALCIATRFCEWDAIEATCGDATWRCEDLKDAAHCSRSDSPDAYGALVTTTTTTMRHRTGERARTCGSARPSRCRRSAPRTTDARFRSPRTSAYRLARWLGTSLCVEPALIAPCLIRSATATTARGVSARTAYRS